jgi:integrase
MPAETKRARRGRGEASIYQRESDGRWVASLSLGFDADGKRKRKTVYGSTKKEVQEELRKIQNQAATGSIPQAGMMTIAALLDHWLEAMKPSWAAGTHESHHQHVRNHIRPSIGGARLKNLYALHVTNMMRGMEENGVSAAMRRHVLVTLRAALAYAVRVNLVPTNPAARAPLPAKSRHKSEGLTPEQITAFIEAAKPDRLFAMYLLAIDSGLRQGELLALTWKDIDPERGTVRVNKSLEEVRGKLAIKEPKNDSSRRTVKLSTATTDALEEHRKAMLAEGHCTPDTAVFCGPRLGHWLRKSDVYRWSFARILKRAGLKFRFHDLRHASASLLLADGVDVKTVQARLGHSAAAITMDVYAHALDRGQQGAADRMQSILTARPKAKTASGVG